MRYPQWDDMAARLVGQFRVQAAHSPDDPRFDRIAAQLCVAGGRFAELWGRHEIQDSAITTIELHCHGAGVARYENLTLGLLGDTDLRFILYLPTSQNAARCAA
jgi:hypothetical protein